MLFCGGCDMDEQFALGIDLMIRGLDQLTGLFKAGVAAREWPADMDPALRARLFMAGVYGLMSQWHLAPGSFPLEAAMGTLAGTGGHRGDTQK